MVKREIYKSSHAVKTITARDPRTDGNWVRPTVSADETAFYSCRSTH